jgi:molybdate transport system substrate-binding protein
MKIRITLAVAALLMQGVSVSAAEIKILSAGGIRPLLQDLIPLFERASGHKIAITFVGGPAVKQQIEGGAAFDLAISNANVIDELAKAGKIAAATRTELGRAGVGVGVRAGAPKPDISTVDAFKRTLLNAKSVAYSGDGTAGTYFEGVLERLGIKREIEPKARKTVAADPANSAMALVARGEAELGVAAMATILTPGVDFVGPLPAELQNYVVFVAGVVGNAKEPKAAADFVKFVTAPAAAAAYKAKGMEPAPQR